MSAQPFVFPFMKTKLYTAFLIFSLVTLIKCHPNQGRTTFFKNGLYGVKSFDGKVITKPIYDRVKMGFYKDHLIASKNGRWGLINNKGIPLTEFKYDHMGYFHEDGLASVTIDKKHGFINKLGVEIIPLIYQDVYSFYDGYARVKLENKWGFIDISGKIIIPTDYDNFNGRPTDSIIPAMIKRKWGFINRKNQTVIPFIYENAYPFSEGLALTENSDYKYGYINSKNQTVVPFIYQNPVHCGYGLTTFKNGYGPIRFKDLSGFVNRKGDYVIPPKYECAQVFYNGNSFVQFDNGLNLQSGYIDSLGNEFLQDHEFSIQSIAEVSPAPQEAIFHNNFLLREKSEYHKKEMMNAEQFLIKGLSDFKKSPVKYPNLNRLNQICITLGLMADNQGLVSRNGKSPFLTGFVYKVLKSETLRESTWDWIRPQYKSVFQELHPIHQKVYKELAVYLKDYINKYDIEKVSAYLKENEQDFAYYDLDGKRDTNRKLSAFVDRLILVHGLVDEKDARLWVNRIADEVISW